MISGLQERTNEVCTCGSCDSQNVNDRRVIVRKGRKVYEVDHPALANVLLAARGLFMDIKSLEPAYKEYKGYIAEKAREYTEGSVTLSVEDTDCTCRVVFGYTCVILPEDVPEMKRLLGDRFDDLVRTKTTYEGTQKLVELASDGDRGRELARHVIVKAKTPSVTFEVKEAAGI